jgi:hypothetical protein
MQIKNYLNYFELILPKMSKEIILSDNVFYGAAKFSDSTEKKMI